MKYYTNSNFTEIFKESDSTTDYMFVPYTDKVYKIKRTDTANSERRFYSFNNVLALIDEMVVLNYISEGWCQAIIRNVLLHV